MILRSIIGVIEHLLDSGKLKFIDIGISKEFLEYDESVIKYGMILFVAVYFLIF